MRAYDKLTDLVTELAKKMHIRDQNLDALGLKEIMAKRGSDIIQSVEASDDDPDDTQTSLRGYKN